MMCSPKLSPKSKASGISSKRWSTKTVCSPSKLKTSPIKPKLSPSKSKGHPYKRHRMESCLKAPTADQICKFMNKKDTVSGSCAVISILPNLMSTLLTPNLILCCWLAYRLLHLYSRRAGTGLHANHPTCILIVSDIKVVTNY